MDTEGVDTTRVEDTRVVVGPTVRSETVRVFGRTTLGITSIQEQPRRGILGVTHDTFLSCLDPLLEPLQRITYTLYS